MTREKFRFAGQTVKVRNEIPKFGGADFTIEDYWQNVTGGTSETVEKGFFCKIKDEPNGEATLSFEMVGVSGKDLTQIVLGCVELGARLGMFDKKESEEISE